MIFTYVVTVEIEEELASADAALAICMEFADCIGRGAAMRLRADWPRVPAVLQVRPVTEIPPPENEDPKAERPAL